MKSILIKLSLLSALFMSFILVSGCNSDDDPVPPQKPKFVELHIDPHKESIMAGVIYYFEATAIDAEGVKTNVNDQVVWSTLLIPAKVEFTAYDAASPERPFVTPKIEGVADIVATLGSLTANAKVTVLPVAALTSLLISPKNASVMVGQTQQYYVEGTYDNGRTADLTYAVTLKGPDAKAVIFDDAGVATATGPSVDTPITASMGTISDGALYSAYAIDSITGLVVTPGVIDMIVGSNQSFTARATVTPPNNIGLKIINVTDSELVVWSSKDSRIVNNVPTSAPNIFVGETEGTTQVSVTHPGAPGEVFAATSDVTVADTGIVITGITLTPATELARTVGQTQFFTVTAEASNGVSYPINESSDLTFTSSNPKVAYFFTNALVDGILFAASEGTADITASFTYNGDVWDSLPTTVTVSAQANLPQ